MPKQKGRKAPLNQGITREEKAAQIMGELFAEDREVREEMEFDYSLRNLSLEDASTARRQRWVESLQRIQRPK